MKTLFASWAVALLLAAGCSRGPVTHPVSGRVEIRPGEPVHVGMIEFVPRETGPTARGQIGHGGVYRLSTFGDGDGAQAGEYTVIVSQPQLFTYLMREAPQEHIDEEHDGVEVRTGVVPDRFSRPQQSGIQAVVEAGDNTIDFVLIEADE
ncbi:hypothetical protein MalM25_27960 [Planctomycetes bacterium MalM25]|nr:hypothetical protein MalM25_27960 [Planctomycetes bacterium MalM25]